MNTRKGSSKMWYLVLLLAALVAGCGSSSNDTVALSSAKGITEYSLAGISGTIDEKAKTIYVPILSGTSKTALVATFKTTGASVKVDGVLQTSGTTTNDFTNPVEYKVTADNRTTATYIVTTAPSSAKAITAYSVSGVSGTINKTAKTISVTLPYSTPSITALIAKFNTTGEIVTVGTTTQISETTPNDFTTSEATPVVYTVAAADGSSVTYDVTVKRALIDDKAITAYSLKGVAGTIDEPAKTIAVTVPKGTNVTALAATFLTTGELVTVGTTTQISGTTTNNFSAPKTYTVTAGDNSTVDYIVTVNKIVSAGPDPVDLGTAGNYVILAKTGASTTGVTHVTGDIGVSPAAATYITGFSLIAHSSNVYSTSSLVTGQIFAANYAVPTPANLTTAVGDMQAAFTDAAGRASDYTELYAGDISGQTLVPGTYKWGTGVLITDAGVTLDGEGDANAVWIFQIAQNLTVNNGAIVHLINGAQAKNIFWQVSGQVTLGTTADFSGIILSQTLISLKTGATVNGRLLAQTAVTLQANAVTEP